MYLYNWLCSNRAGICSVQPQYIFIELILPPSFLQKLTVTGQINELVRYPLVNNYNQNMEWDWPNNGCCANSTTIVIPSLRLVFWLNHNAGDSSCNAGDSGSIPGSGKFPGGGTDSPLQYSCLGNAMDRGAWCAVVHGVAKESNMT